MPYQRLVSILFYEKSEPSELKEVISTQHQTSMICMRSSTTSIDTVSIDDMKIAALKDDDSMSTLGSNHNAPSAASVDALSTFEQWNISRRPFYQISDDLTQKIYLQHLYGRSFFKVHFER